MKFHNTCYANQYPMNQMPIVLPPGVRMSDPLPPKGSVIQGMAKSKSPFKIKKSFTLQFMSAEQFHQILKFGRERGRRSLVLSGALCTKVGWPLSLPNFKIWWNYSADMNCNVKDYLILKGDFNFAIPWIPLPMTPGVPGAPEPRMYPRSGYFLVYHNSNNWAVWKTWILKIKSFKLIFGVPIRPVCTANLYSEITLNA